VSRKGRPVIVVSRHDALGDLVTTFPLLAALREVWPEARLLVLARPAYNGVTAELPAVDGTLDWQEIEPGKLRKLGMSRRASKTKAAQNAAALRQQLQQEEVDCFISVYPRASLGRLVRSAGIRWRVGTAMRWYSPFVFNIRRREHRKDSRYHESVYSLGLLHSMLETPALVRELAPQVLPGWVAEAREKLLIPDAARLTRFPLPESLSRYSEAQPAPIVIHPFKTASSLKWPPEAFAALIQEIRKEFPEYPLILTGQQPERTGLEAIRSQFSADEPIEVVTSLNLLELVGLLQAACLWVGNSTGPMHLAAWAGTPVVALFGRAPAFTARRWGPIYQEDSIGLEPDVPACSRCIQERCRYFNCLEHISAAQVMEHIRPLLGKN
jgi:ADP-heptose:LPS heptosyltransferase